MSVIALPQTRAAGGGVSSPAPKIPVEPYDRILPEGYWQGLVPPKVTPPPRRSKAVTPWILGGLGFILVAGALAWVTARSTHLNENGYALESMGTPNPPRALARELLPPPLRVSRGILVSVPVRRAQLVSLPIGASFLAHMPYGETVRCTYLGDLPNQEALPLEGNHIGDMYNIGRYQFVWAAPAGGVAQWIDP